MKGYLKRCLSLALALTMTLSNASVQVWANEGAQAPELPTATVTEIENEDLTFALNFKADDVSDAQLAYYGDWSADYVLTINKDVTFNANGEADGYLSGQYDAWSENWVDVPLEDVTLEAGKSLKIMEYATEMMGQSGQKVTYADIYESVKEFNCGVFFDDEFLAANEDLEVTLELCMYNPADETESYVIGETYTFTLEDEEAPELPTATVEKIKNDDLTFALNFKADEVSDTQLAYYGDWHADFELKVNKDVTLNANGGADGYLSGQYDAWSENWVNVPFDDVTLKAGETLKIMEYAAEMMGQPGLKVTYNDVYTSVKDFDCGVFFEPEFLAKNPDLKVTLELRMYNPADESESYTIGETYIYTLEDVAPTLPTATVTEIENDELTFAMNFKADEVSDAQLAYYGDWHADFELKVNKDVTLNANGGADGYLSGQYDAWSENWANVPFENVTLKAGETLKIMEYAAEMMGQPGLKVTYNDVYTSVKDFDCGVFFEENFLAANPDLEVTLELRMYNPADESESYTIGETYIYTLEDVAPTLPTATVTEIENDELTFAMNFKADPVTDEQLAYYGDWYADFELKVNKDVTLNANGGANGYLSGQYDAWSENWVNVPFENVTLKAGETLKIMEYAAEMMGQSGLKVTYNDVYTSVKDFDCGVFFEPAFLAANPDLEVTLELRMYNPADESESYVIGETYIYTVEALALPTATVTEIENEELTFALNFKTDEVTEAQLAYYGDWYADFELKVNKDVTLNANGGANGYLSGQYDAWSENWVNVPFEAVTLKAGESLKIMEYAAEMLGKPGLKYTYGEVYESVKDFDCGVFFEPAFLAANPDLEVTLELRMYNPADETESYVIGETYTFTAKQALAVAQNTNTGKYYSDVTVALLEAAEGETVILLKDVEPMVLSVYKGTFDLNGHKVTASYVTSYGNIIDDSDANNGLLIVEPKKFLVQKDNAQLPVKTEEGYKFVEVTKFNVAYKQDKYGFQPFIEPAAHESLKDGSDASAVNIMVRVSWKNEKGEDRSQNFVYGDEMVEGFIDSYLPKTGKYGQMFSLQLNNAPEGLKYQAIVVSETGIEFASALVDHPFSEAPDSDGASGDVTTDANNKVTENVTLASSDEKTSAVVPQGTQLEANTTSLTLTVNDVEDSASNITLGENEVQKSVDIHIEGVSADNTVPMIITLKEFAPVSQNLGNLNLYHVENGATNAMTQVASVEEVDAHNEFYYDPATGDVVMALATFSEVAVVSDNTAAWEGNFDYSWYTNAVVAADGENAADYKIANADQLAAFGAIVGGMNGQTKDSFAGKTVKLLADINLGDAEKENNPDLIFYPIGYYNSTGSYEKKSGGSVNSSVSSFEGIFDGQGHTISNFYQNTWEMFGDYNDGYSGTPNYYKDAMGLFGYVVNGTVKNLTVDNFSSDGEFTPTGVIAAYAAGNTTFANIAITNCNPSVYNTGNGGIIGIAGDTSAANDDHITLRNITVDNSNKISALWGSYDVACGGLVGMYRGNVDGSGNVTGDTISFENCHVSAIMDVYNDVCGNYQYYAYRYAGMIIGSIRHNTTTTIDGETRTIPNMTGISATGCTVNYGDWNDYYYCEFEKNGHPSYSGENDYKFSRVPHSELEFEDSNGNGSIDENERDSVTGCKHNHTNAENNQAIYLPFHQLFTGYSWGVSSIGLKEYSGIVTDLGITEGDQQESVVKFEQQAEYPVNINSGDEIDIGKFFKAVDELAVPIDVKNVQVFVSPVGEDSTAGAEYEANAEDWTKGKLKFFGDGEVTISITDYNFCETTTLENVIVHGADVFATKFTGNFLYRVGNANEIHLSNLFEAKDGQEIDAGSVQVKISRIDPDTYAVVATAEEGDDYTYTANSDWTKGTIKFKNVTGPYKISIKDKNSKWFDLNVEVVDAYNVTTYNELKNRNSVLLKDIAITKNGTYSLANATLYGNGFVFDVTDAKDGDTVNGYIGGNYAVSLRDAILDNIRIVGEVYTQYGAQAKSMYNYPTVLTNGNTIIANSYISNGSAAVRAQDGDLQIINSTLEGGIFANLDIRGGTVTLDNVTTINQSTADGKSTSNDKGIVGLGIVFYECNVNAHLYVNSLTQYNYISKNLTITDTTVNQLKNAMFGTNHTALQFEDDNGVIWVNAGIMSATEGIGDANIDQIDDYVGKTATIAGKTGYIYTKVPTAEDVRSKPDGYKSVEQYNVLPTVVFDHEKEQNKAPSEGSNDFCHYDANTKLLSISFDEGKNKVYDPNILTVTKVGETLTYTVKIDGVDYTGKTITFDKTGTHKAVYTYTDPYNYKLDEDDEVVMYSVTYEKTVEIAVNAVEAKAKDAKFTFYGYSGISKTATTTITDVKTETSKSGNLYIMPSSTGTYVTSKTIDGITVNCPRVYVDFKDNTSDFNWLYPVFLGVKIEDYADGGTAETATTIVSPTSTSKPTNLTILTVDKPTGGGGWSSGSGKSGSEGKLGSGTYKNLYGWTSGALGSDQPENSIYAQFTYKDKKGTTYYYVIEFYRAAHKCPTTCVTPDTLITLADGSQKRVDALSFEDKIMAWDFFTGSYVEKDIALLVNHGEDTYDVANLKFSDGTALRLIGEHGVFDYDLNKYVYITVDNMQDYVGHRFVQYDSDGSYNIVTLVEAYSTEEVTSAYSITSAGTSNAFASGMLTVAPPDDFYNWIEMDGKLHYDVEKFNADVEQYGLYTYDVFADYVTYEQFVDWNGAYLKIPVEKGYFTFDYILELINLYKGWMHN